MSEYIFLHRGIRTAAEARIDALSSAALHGRGLFTTVRVIGEEPFLWEKHWIRLSGNAARLGIDTSEYTETIVRGALTELIKVNHLIDGRARITFFDDGWSSLWSRTSKCDVGLLLMTGPSRDISRDYCLTLSPYRINSASPLAGVKSCSYLEKLLAHDEARSRGFDEAVQLNERGHVASACMANVFWLSEGKLYTPSLSTGCLQGTTREFVLENLDCEEVEVGIETLQLADAIFLTSAGLGVVQVNQFEDRPMPQIDHPISHLIDNPGRG